jgi:hypothetical protein
MTTRKNKGNGNRDSKGSGDWRLRWLEFGEDEANAAYDVVGGGLVGG